MPRHQAHTPPSMPHRASSATTESMFRLLSVHEEPDFLLAHPVAGDALVRRFFKHYFNDELRDRVEIIARYPENVTLALPFQPQTLAAPASVPSRPGQAILADCCSSYS